MTSAIVRPMKPTSVPKVRLFADQPLAAGQSLALSEGAAHYLGSVMRAKVGDWVKLFNGRDGEWLAELIELRKGKASVRLDSLLRPPVAEPDVWLIFAPIKGHRFDNIIEKATELGVSVLQPVLTRHCVVPRVNEERLRANAIEAAEQCERFSIPEIRPLRPLAEVLASWPAERRLVLLDESGGGAPLPQVLAQLLPKIPAQIPPPPLALLVGPEGGFAKTELDAVRQSSFALPVGLGPRILRADTAAIAALACVMALSGQWAAAPSFRSGPESASGPDLHSDLE